MLANIQKHDLSIIVSHPDEPFKRRAVDRGAIAAASALEAAAESDIVVTQVPSMEALRHVYESEQGIFAGARAGTTIVDCSAVAPEFARQLSERARAIGLHLADAPPSGGLHDARLGTLSFSVGADRKVFDTVLPVLRMMGRFALYCGGPGSGQAARLCNSVLWAVSEAATIEAMALGASLGIEPSTLAAFINACNEHSRVSGDHVSQVSGRKAPGEPREPDISIDIALRDVSLALEAANESRQSLILTTVVRQLLRSSAERGWGGKNCSWLGRLYHGSERPSSTPSSD
ncbi:NAD(P)-binding domain-containing protein [Paraburkholderia sp. USG1]|uniref:NAD(P)-dependent oxidoreductase n=1 Tax=Paraburkholderia sp. USG1 TaxID=2952268 RepID=UPI00285F3F47|nr:NAD(P)-binding domain-containing protein [Paraburkholderia sp. USG1]MDR8401819.1 NAD(P)-binding domain-containing protein [Paraburkholderia sp. USG1]